MGCCRLGLPRLALDVSDSGGGGENSPQSLWPGPVFRRGALSCFRVSAFPFRVSISLSES